MTSLKIKGTKNEDKGNVILPSQFQEPIRADLIKRAFLAVRANKRQPYGAMVGAGMRPSAKLSRRRRDYRGSYGIGISRVPRKIHSRRGTRMNWVAAVMPGAVGGRQAHPPKAEKIWEQKINAKERRKAVRSALAASVDAETCTARGHAVPTGYPFALDNAFEGLTKTKDIVTSLTQLGLHDEFVRSAKKNVRAGKGKMRGRKYQRAKGVLLVVSGKCPLAESALNIPGVDIARADSLNAELLAPGGHPGRLTLYTQKSLETIKEKRYYA